MNRLHFIFLSLLTCGTLLAQEGPLSDSFVNPLPLPDYPLGNWARKPSPNLDRYLKGYVQDFRELADPSVLYDDG